MNDPATHGVRSGANGEERSRYYDIPHESRHHEKTLAEIIAEIRDELRDFVSTRVRIVRAEIQESIGAAKVGVPLAIVALGFFAIASLLLTAACVALVAAAFAGNPYAWFYAFIIIGCLWAIFGGVAGFFAYNQFKGIFPKRTIEVIKADKLWLETEARSHS
jgi:uncharacterized membrane protein YqjE